MSMVARGWVSSGVLGLLVLAAVAQPVSAQAQEPFFKIKPDPAVGGTISKLDGFVTVYLNLTVDSDQQNQLRDQFRILVNVTKTDDHPNGWSVAALEMAPEDGVIRPGEKLRVTVRVETTIPNPSGDQTTIQFTITSKPVFQGAAGPLTDQLVKQMSQEDKDTSAKAVVKRQLDTYEKITGLAKSQPWLFLLLAGGVFGLAVVLIRRKKGGLLVSSESPIQQVLPGRGASFPVKVVNEGGAKQSLTLGTSDVPPGWSAILPVDRIELQGNESTTIWLTLKAPPTAHPGEHVQLNFIASGTDGASSETLLEASVVQTYGAEGAAPPPQPLAAPEPTPSPRRRR
ncbi:MAG: hypothetical protein HYT80_12205 [Euryarchaeota archaeon]|nr:hypothetical protein [Euryarchaeota archaeon]